MVRQRVVIYERRGTWGRQLRPRLTTWPIRWVESRSVADLERALGRSSCPIVVLDLGDRLAAGLEALDLVAQLAPNALILVLDPAASPGVSPLVRELGATQVLSGVVAPPVVAAWVERWLPLARRRAEADGWAGDPDPEPWDRLAPLNP